MNWCVRLATGGAGALLFIEDRWDLVVYPSDQGRVRFIMARPVDMPHLRGDRRMERAFDVVLPCRTLVAALYDMLQSLTEDKALFRIAWHEAVCMTPGVRFKVSFDGLKFAFGSCPTCPTDLPDYRSEIVEVFPSKGD